MTSTLFLIGCGNQEKSVNLEVSTGMAIGSEGFSGGLVVSGKNDNGERFVKSVFGGTKVVITLPNGTWDVSVVGWNGSAPATNQPAFSGTPHCGKSIVSFGTQDSVTITATPANCLGSDFSGSPYLNTASTAINPLKILTCGSFYNHTAAASYTKLTMANYSGTPSSFCQSSFHPRDLKSRTKSLKLIPINKELNGKFEPLLGANPYCISATSQGVFNITQQIPVSNLPVMVGYFEDSNCSDLKNFVVLPDGLKNGNSDRLDSLFAYVSSDDSAPYTSNRLLLPESELQRGWSAFYDQMPHVKCASGFCGELFVGSSSGKYTDGIFDIYIDLAYQPTVNDWRNISFEAPSDICTSLSIPTTIGYTNHLQKGACSYSNGRINLQVKSTVDISACPSDMYDLCRSPAAKFVLGTPNGEKEIFFGGQKDYSGDTPVRFNHFGQQVYQGSPSSTTCAVLNPTNVSISGNNQLVPGIFCQLDAVSNKPLIFAQTAYNNTTKTFKTDESGGLYGQIYFYDPSQTFKNLIMLPPDYREQISVMNLMFESVGNTSLIESFKYQGSHNGGNEDKSYGSISHIREMFSPKGPTGLFDHTLTCANTVGVKTLSMERDGVVVNYEIEISNINSSYPSWATDLNLYRPDTYCTAANPNETSCATTLAANYGRFEKSMRIKRNGTLIEVMYFDCSAKIGRYESKSSEVEEGKYRREKEIFFWNTEDASFARFERYSHEMESSDLSFSTSGLIRNRRKFEQVGKKNAASKITGRVIEYSLERDQTTNTLQQHVNHLHFMLNDSSGWQFLYSFYNFHEPATVDMFTSAKYSPMAGNYLNDQHFCGNNLNFPMSYNSDCSTVPFPTEVSSVYGTSSIQSYGALEPSNFNTIMGSGIFTSW